MKDLPALYAAVCAKRPELAVDTLQHYMRAWWYHGDAEGHDIAAALILARWVEAMPGEVSIANFCNGWRVWYWVEDDRIEYRGSTPIEALAAFYMEYAK